MELAVINGFRIHPRIASTTLWVTNHINQLDDTIGTHHIVGDLLVAHHKGTEALTVDELSFML